MTDMCEYWIIETDYGTEKLPDEFVREWKALPKRKDGQPDRRRCHMMPFEMYEDFVVLAMRDEWVADGALTYFPEWWGDGRG